MTGASHFTPPPYLKYFIDRYLNIKIDLASSSRVELTESELQPFLSGCKFYGNSLQESEIAFVETFTRRYELEEDISLFPVTGATCGNYIAINALVPNGGSVAVERPVYDPIPYTVMASGREVKSFSRRAENGYVPDIDELEQLLRSGAKLFFLSNLHNPTGAFLNEDFFRSFAVLLEQYDAYALIDEIYIEFRPSWRRDTSLRFSNRFLVSASLSKAYGLEELRAGWLAGSQEVLNLCRDYWLFISAHCSAPGLLMAVHLEQFLDEWLAEGRSLIRQNNEFFSQWVDENGLQAQITDYSPISLLQLPKGMSDLRLAQLAYEKFGLFLAPASFFSLPGNLRIGLFKPSGIIEKGLQQLAGCIDESRI